jgi:uncharacterized protein with GYD domain
MATYVLMTKLDPSALRDPRGRRKTGEDWLARVENLCPGLKWRAHYALLGPYDFMDVYEAPDEETAFRVSLLSRELGAVSAESWPALPYDDFLPIAESVDSTAQGKAGKKKNKKNKKKGKKK